ncbi:MAG: hypothetical protein N2691_02270 [Patescibacteria group bacterium]|nr:hypothetical protein [Patescibacteria group bacterium]
MSEVLKIYTGHERYEQQVIPYWLYRSKPKKPPSTSFPYENPAEPPDNGIVTQPYGFEAYQRRFNQELSSEHATVYRGYLAEMTQNEIAENYGLRQERVAEISEILKEKGYLPDEIDNDLTFLDAIRASALQGKTPIEIANEIRQRPETVLTVLCKLVRTCALRRSRSVTDETIIWLRAIGSKNGEIENILNLSEYQVHRYIKRLRKEGKLPSARIKHEPDPEFWNMSRLSPDSAYVLGLFIADGHLSIRGDEINIWGRLNDDNLNLFRYLAFVSGAVLREYKEKNPVVGICVSRTDVVKRFREMGFEHNKDFTAKIPDCVFTEAPEMLPHVIRGIFDGDGSVFIPSQYNNLRATFATCSPSLIRQLTFLLKAMGIECRLRKSPEEMEEALKAYQIFGKKEAKAARWNVQNAVSIQWSYLLALYRLMYQHPRSRVTCLHRKRALFEAELLYEGDIRDMRYTRGFESHLHGYIRQGFPPSAAEELLKIRAAVGERTRSSRRIIQLSLWPDQDPPKKKVRRSTRKYTEQPLSPDQDRTDSGSPEFSAEVGIRNSDTGKKPVQKKWEPGTIPEDVDGWRSLAKYYLEWKETIGL